jgi:hypothetical protein
MKERLATLVASISPLIGFACFTEGFASHATSISYFLQTASTDRKGFASISAQLFVCPKRAKLPSYLAFYLLLMPCLFALKGQNWLLSCLLSLATAFLSMLASLNKQA